jgi:arylsulfatase A-like enzyme
MLQDASVEHRSFAVSEFVHETMYLDRDWKLMLNRNDEPYRLFDLKNDPYEVQDLATEKRYESVIADLKRTLVNHRAQTRQS